MRDISIVKKWITSNVDDKMSNELMMAQVEMSPVSGARLVFRAVGS